MRPMSWCSGSQDNPVGRGWPGSSGSGQKSPMIRAWTTSARWERTMGLGLDVVPEESWIKAGSSSRASRSGAGAVSVRFSRGRPPRSVDALSRTSSRNRRNRLGNSTPRAEIASTRRAARRGQSPRRPKRTGGSKAAGTAPAARAPKKAVRNPSPEGKTRASRSPGSTPAWRKPPATRRARASSSLQDLQVSRSRRSRNRTPAVSSSPARVRASTTVAGRTGGGVRSVTTTPRACAPPRRPGLPG